MPSFDVLLAPGASADRNQPALLALDHALGRVGGNVLRMDFPYRKAGRRAPDRPPVLLAAVRAELDGLRGPDDRRFLGGRSMGGRICSMVVADGLAAAGLILLSYPLHPPGRPERLRTEHFGGLRCPCLFVSGTKDAFGTPDELEAASAAIPGRVTHHWIDGKGHDLRGADQQVAGLVVPWVLDILG